MAKKIESKRDKGRKEMKDVTPATFAFGRDNYIIILGGVVLLIIGYLLMVGGGASNNNEFNPEIFDTQRVTIAPVTLLIGFAVVLYGIMRKPKNAE